MVGAMVSFQEGSELQTELAGVAVDSKQVENRESFAATEIMFLINGPTGCDDGTSSKRAVCAQMERC